MAHFYWPSVSAVVFIVASLRAGWAASELPKARLRPGHTVTPSSSEPKILDRSQPDYYESPDEIYNPEHTRSKNQGSSPWPTHSSTARNARRSVTSGYNTVKRRRDPIKPKSHRSVLLPLRRERCDSDIDCQRSLNHICIKRAREPFGRCQCPFFVPVEITVGGVLRCVSAKDVYDECRSADECAASSPNLQCINKLCVCLPPYILKDQHECVPAAGGLNETQVRSVVRTATVFLVVTIASGALWFIGRKFQKRACCTTGSSERRSTFTRPAVTEQPSVRHDSQSHSAHDATRPEGVLKNIMLRSISPAVLKKCTQRTLTDPSATSNHPTEANGGAQQCDPLTKLWAQKKFKSMASPLYQNKLIERLRKGPHPAEENNQSFPPQPNGLPPANPVTPSQYYRPQETATMPAQQAPLQWQATANQYPFNMMYAQPDRLSTYEAYEPSPVARSGVSYSQDTTSYANYQYPREVITDGDHTARSRGTYQSTQ